MTARRRIIFSLCTIGLAAVGIHARIRQQMPPRESLALHTSPKSAAVSSLARALRPNYPYSIVSGGVYSPAELLSAIAHNPALRQHYAALNLKKMHLVRVTEDRYAYVSFRQNGRFFWTRKRLLIPRGEILLTDGEHYVRTRCGNLLSERGQRSTTPFSEPTRALSTPALTSQNLSGLEFIGAEPDSSRKPLDFASRLQPITPDTGLFADRWRREAGEMQSVETAPFDSLDLGTGMEEGGSGTVGGESSSIGPEPPNAQTPEPSSFWALAGLAGLLTLKARFRVNGNRSQR